jgi:hypothetical protein
MEQGGRSLRYLVRTGVFLGVLLGAAIYFAGSLSPLFRANPPLNGIILALLVVGLGDVLFQLGRLVAEDRYLDRVRNYLAFAEQGMEPPERANEAILYGQDRGLAEFLRTLHQVVIRGHHQATLPYLLDSLAERGESRRTLPRYLAGTLIVLGLLGTFWGLLQTVQGVRGIIETMGAEEYDDVAAFVTALRSRMAVPIEGMALAFSTSLFGLGASLVLGFAETQLGRAVAHGQTRVEEVIVTGLLPFWRAQARPEGLDLEAAERPAYTAALLEGISHRLDDVSEEMRRLVARQPDPEAVARAVERNGDTLRQEVQELSDRMDRHDEERSRSLRDAVDRLSRVLAREAGGDHGAP